MFEIMPPTPNRGERWDGMGWQRVEETPQVDHGWVGRVCGGVQPQGTFYAAGEFCSADKAVPDEDDSATDGGLDHRREDSEAGFQKGGRHRKRVRPEKDGEPFSGLSELVFRQWGDKPAVGGRLQRRVQPMEDVPEAKVDEQAFSGTKSGIKVRKVLRSRDKDRLHVGQPAVELGLAGGQGGLDGGTRFRSGHEPSESGGFDLLDPRPRQPHEYSTFLEAPRRDVGKSITKIEGADLVFPQFADDERLFKTIFEISSGEEAGGFRETLAEVVLRMTMVRLMRKPEFNDALNQDGAFYLANGATHHQSAG
jgi:hypothetical protein